MFVYQVGPVDFFSGMLPIAMAADRAKEECGDEAVFDLFRFVMECARYVSLAKDSFWEGDIRGKELYVFAIPDADSCSQRFGLVWKQDNNGTTFICSPVELPWINQGDRI